MAKSIITPEYIKISVYNVLSSFPDLSGENHGKEKTIKDQVSEPDNIPEDKEEESLFFTMWLTEQFKRYEKVYNSVERHFKNNGIILPPEPIDFMKWFVKYARKSQDYLTVKIEDVHFILYHEERLKVLHKTERWDDLYKELSTNGYILTSPEVFNHVMEFKQLPVGTEKIQWQTFQADALEYQANFGFSMPQFNNCFKHHSNRKFSLGASSKVARKEPLKSILIRYKPRG
jgi:hypothetical protein